MYIPCHLGVYVYLLPQANINHRPSYVDFFESPVVVQQLKKKKDTNMDTLKG